MFDSSLCGRTKQDGVAHVSSAALLALKGLLSATPSAIESDVVQAQHLFSSSGDADAHTVTVQNQSGRVIFSTGEATAVVAGDISKDGPPAGPDVERTSAEAAMVQRRTTGGGR